MSMDFIWSEKYRPEKIDDIILPTRISSVLKSYVEKGSFPNLIFTGTSGIGKTTAALALCKELDIEVYFINASLYGDINTLRNEIEGFASSISFTGRMKCVILDEAERLTNDTSLALRGMIQQFSKNCVFIFTCNNKNRIIEPLHSRCTLLDFSLNKGDLETLAPRFLKKIASILDLEKIEYDKAVLVQFVKRFYPDWRKIINELQGYSPSGKIDSGILVKFDDESVRELIGYLKTKAFTKMRQWVALNSDIPVPTILEKLYNTAHKYVTKETLPELILLINKCQVQHPIVANPEINLCAFFVEVMVEVKFNET